MASSCQIGGCQKPIRIISRGWCEMHYTRWLRHGDPLHTFWHGYGTRGKVSPTYRSWQSMKKRCQDVRNENYSYYGGRGITFCERWLDFRNFLADMGERGQGLTLDRIDNDGNYEPGNCKWSTRSEQAFNRRKRKVA